ncbi:MAG: hypothetical protein ACTHNN_06885 [Xanthobacteraceae bacterium]
MPDFMPDIHALLKPGWQGRPAMTRGYDRGDKENTDIAAREDYINPARHVRAFAVTQG